jgi:hypothetical protein
MLGYKFPLPSVAMFIVDWCSNWQWSASFVVIVDLYFLTLLFLIVCVLYK